MYRNSKYIIQGGNTVLIKKGLATGIIVILFLGSSFAVISSSIQNVALSSPCISKGNTLYVGGSGPGNYSRIQDAINDSSDGDIVFVYNGTYYENILLNKQIELTGEDKYSTVIDGNDTSDVVNITSDGTRVSHFMIMHSGGGPSWFNAGVQINSHYNSISNCIIENNYVGLLIERYSTNNEIKDNTISYNEHDGITLIYNSNENRIYSNEIHFNQNCGIYIGQSNDIWVYHNNITNNPSSGISGWEVLNSTLFGNYLSNNHVAGIGLGRSKRNNIFNNWIFNNDLYGIELHSNTSSNHIYENIFINNQRRNAYNWDEPGLNLWDNGYMGNYWDDYEEKYPNATNNGLIWDTPYEILFNNSDRYPLVIDPLNIPKVEIITPNNGDLYGNIVDIKWNITNHFNEPLDNCSITVFYRVEDGDWTQIIEDLNDTGFYSWVLDDFELSDNWEYSIRVDATYENFTRSDIVGDIGIDVTPPTVKIIRPEQGQIFINELVIFKWKGPTIIIGPVTILVEAEDNLSGIDKIVFSLDSGESFIDTELPYSWYLNEKRIGRRLLTVTGYDNVGHLATDELELIIINVFGG